MTRIITGERKGLHLYNPKNKRIRPTSDRVKEWIFSVLGSLEDVQVLDLYCGAGNLGIEALSRGAAQCDFVDTSRDAVALTRRNVERAVYLSSARIIRRDCLAYLSQTDEKYHLVFADPPYHYTGEKSLFDTVRNVLYSKAMFVYESAAKVAIQVPNDLEIVRTRQLGTTTITLSRYLP